MIKREHYIRRIIPFIDKDVIKVLTGIRRSGKSVMLKLIMEELRNRGIKDEQLISINFENLKNRNYRDYEKLYEHILNRTDSKYNRYYIFLDEILEVDEDYSFDIYITGSNAKLLSGELATYLAGRYVEFIIYPFSFQEFLEIIGEQDKKNSTREAFWKYLRFGGMPFLHNLNFDYEAGMQYLQDIYASIILKDITQRNNIRDTDLLERIIGYLIMNIGNTFSATSVSKFFKSENRKVATETVLNYIKACEDSFLVYKVPRNDLIGKKVLNINEKYYIADHGIREAILESNQRDINQVLENIVYVEMIRRGYNVRIGKMNNLEIDFVCMKNKETVYIQVSYLLASDETIKREFSVLESIQDNYPKYVLSMDESDMSGKGIRHMNIIDFLLNKEI